MVRVGKGRGFVVEGKRGRVVITAAHCLPKFPICGSYLSEEEHTYRALLGPLGKKSTVSAICQFADPIGDIAVLGSPDNKVFATDADDFQALVGEAVPLSTSKVAVTEGSPPAQGWMLSLDQQWFPCKVVSDARGRLWISEAVEGIRGGMSGSPILSGTGSTIGVVTTGGDDGPDGGPDPQLMFNLPGWLLRDLDLFRPKDSGSGRTQKIAVVG